MNPPDRPQPAIELDRLRKGESGVVVAVASSPEFDRSTGLDLARRLMELGFIPNERLRVLHKGLPGGDPIVVRIGHSTFALRRFEASLISVRPEAAA